MPRSRRDLVALAVAVAIVGGACRVPGGGGSVTASPSGNRPAPPPTSAGSADAPRDALTRLPLAETATSDVGTPPAATEAPGAATTSGAVISEAPATDAPAASNEPPTTAAAGEGGGTTWWPWVVAVVAVAVVIGLAWLLARSRRRAQWPDAAGAALDESDQITTELLALPPGRLGSVAGAEAARLAAVAASVDQLMGSAPDETSRLALARLMQPMRPLHGRLDAVAVAAMPAGAADESEVRAQASELHGATALARATLLPSQAAARRR